MWPRPSTVRPSVWRHALLLAMLSCLVGLSGCTGVPSGESPAAGAARSALRGDDLLSPWRTLQGGFLAPPQAPGRLPPMAGAGMFVRLMAPMAVALRGQEAVVQDAQAQRLWRLDTAMGTMSGIAGAPATLGVALALGGDLSAWVLEPAARQVLRFARDGRLLQTYRIDQALPSPVALALADGGANLLVADGMGAQWSQVRGPSGIALTVQPSAADGQRISGVDGLVPDAGSVQGELWVLDRLGGAVHRVRRDGEVLRTLGRGALMQPTALAADRRGRVFVVDQGGQRLTVLQDRAAPRHYGAAQLGVQQIGGIAVDESLLALTDRTAGALVLWRLAPGSAEGPAR